MMDATLYTQPKIDCHCHVLDPNGFAYASDVSYQPAGPETGSAQYFAHVLEAYGVQHALLVGPNSGYGTDNRCLLDAIANSKGRFKGIAVVANQTSLNELADLKGHGIVGIAFNYALHGLAHYQTNTALLEHLAALGMFVQVQTIEDQLATLTPALLGCGAQILIDHCGRPTHCWPWHSANAPRSSCRGFQNSRRRATRLRTRRRWCKCCCRPLARSTAFGLLTGHFCAPRSGWTMARCCSCLHQRCLMQTSAALFCGTHRGACLASEQPQQTAERKERHDGGDQ
jgi:Amidohydrolase